MAEINLIATHALQIRATEADGVDAPTYAVATGAGTGGAGTLTITTNTDGATVIDLGAGASDTIAEVVEDINALTGVEARANRLFDLAPLDGSTDLSGASEFNTVTSTEIGRRWENILQWTATNVSVAAASTDAMKRAHGVDVELLRFAEIHTTSVLAGTGTDDTTFNFAAANIPEGLVSNRNNIEKSLQVLTDSDYLAGFHTVITHTNTGTTQVSEMNSADVAGIEVLKLESVTNGDAGDAVTITAKLVFTDPTSF